MKRRYKWVVGIDEVGRGPLAGPITIGAIAMGSAHHKSLRGIKDSKKLSAKKREEWFFLIQTYAKNPKENPRINPRILFVTSSVGPRVIDRMGIVRATKIAIGRSLKKISLHNSKFTIYNSRVVLDGGLKAPKAYKNQQTISKGDQKVPIIAAASIIAKVTRDRKMVRLSKAHPEYGFDAHKGYGTKMHIRALKKHGLCGIHRRSFCGRFL